MTMYVLNEHSAVGPAALILMVLSALSVLLFVELWWRSPEAPEDGDGAGANVMLSCSRCGRVVELPREHARGARFCPRCGATLSRDS